MFVFLAGLSVNSLYMAISEKPPLLALVEPTYKIQTKSIKSY
jgi:hypothetical protein